MPRKFRYMKDWPNTGRWRPIATSPKTGEVRLLTGQGAVHLGFWGWCGTAEKGQKTWRHSDNWKPIRPPPTHWMPPPRAKR